MIAEPKPLVCNRVTFSATMIAIMFYYVNLILHLMGAVLRFRVGNKEKLVYRDELSE